MANQELVYIFFAITILVGVVFGSLTFFVIKYRSKILQKEIEKKNTELQFQKELTRASITIQEVERERIAQELHDEVSSKMNIIHLQSNILIRNKIHDKEALEALTIIAQVAKTILETSRQIAHNLLPPVLEKFGLHAAIKELQYQFNNADAIINYDNELGQAAFDTISKAHHIHFFRILQELITNSVTHGKATVIDINIYDNVMRYEDNGIGITTHPTNDSKGLGTKNILNRTEILKGTFEIGNKNKNGILATLTWNET